MNRPDLSPRGVFPIVVVVAAIGCDDFTCEDYATCESSETARDGGGGDSGKFAGSTTTGVYDDEASSAPAPDGGVDDSSLLGSSSADRGDADNAANESSTMARDSSYPDAEGDGGATLERPGASLDSNDGGSGDQDAKAITTHAPINEVGSIEADSSFGNSSSDASIGDSTSGNTAAVTSSEGLTSIVVPPDAGLATSEPESTTTSDVSSGVEVRCDLSKPFGRPFAIDAVNLDSEVENVMVTPDGLTMYVRYGSDLTTYVVTRDSVFEDFGIPRPHAGFDSILEQEPTLQPRSITADGLTVYLSSDTWGDLIQSSHRETSLDEFEVLTVHDEFEAFDFGLADPWVTPGGERLYGFLPASYNLWAAELQDSTFEAPSEVHEGGMTAFVLSNSERVLYFGATSVANGGVWRTERVSKDAAFTDEQPLSVLNSEFHDLPLWVSDDDCELIFVQEGELKGDGLYTSDVFVARRGL